jgi:ubiquinone biosynthesis protein
MIYFLLRVAVNALALAITVFLLPGIHVYAWEEGFVPLLLTYLVMGLLFGFINSLVRPLVILLFGKLLLWTVGLFTWVINSLLLVLLSLVTPAIWVVDEPLALWVILAGALMGIIATILEAIVGLNSSLEGEGRRQDFYWRWLSKLPTGRRSRIIENLRTQQVYDAMRRYGVDMLIGQTPVSGLTQWAQRFIYPDRQTVTAESMPVKVRLMLQELGPTYVKMGQMAASRSDILPEELVVELEKLHDDVSPFPYADVEAIISKELGCTPDTCFASFSREPVAAASMAQVHRAFLPDGEVVAVKVQRPNIEVTVKGDLGIVADVVNTMEKRSQRIRGLGLSGMLDEFGSSIIEELDFRNEAFNAQMLSYNMREFPQVQAPQIYESLSTSRVITMSFFEGVKITDYEGDNRTELAQVFTEAMIRQVMIDGFFHADPHPGNLLVDPETGMLTFLDLGMMGTLNQEQRLLLLDLIWSLNEADSQHVADLVLKLTTPTQTINQATFFQDVDRMVKRHLVFGQGAPVLSDIAEEVFGLLFRYHLRLEQEFTLAFKALMQAEETMRTLAPELSMFDTSVDAVKGVISEQLEPQVVSAQLKTQATRAAKNAVVQIPAWKQAARRWLDQLESGRFAIQLEAEEVADSIESIEGNLDRNVRRLSFVLLNAGLLVGSAIASNAPLQDFLPPEIAVLLFVPFAIAVVVAILYLFRLLWESWKQRD